MTEGSPQALRANQDPDPSSKPLGSFSEAFRSLKESKYYEEPAKPSDEANSGPTPSAATHAASLSRTSASAVVVNNRQRGNPLLKFIRSVPWEYGDVVPDYVMGTTSCALFLSLRYHNLNPDYIHDRLKELGRQFALRVLLVQVDIKDPHHSLKHLTQICLRADMTLMLAWSAEEAGRILETYKAFEHKPPDLIMEKQDNNPLSRVVDALATVRSVNRTDAMTLLSTFGSLEKILKASADEIALCPGFGPQKASRLHQALHMPFKRKT
ncbi:unnamed protein product [Darwinula stevensoni]|uniref:DNA excision repair protein ERCC-1 n=1 Tax=Darwinula stevensoni TaxID=69355 RepID=A0A7R9FS88_9CRUS|nr:unnamed protein product [Darwinula stevensoni]CAG0903014.1 unnamed protein product [Darwinula stevensoni]